MTSFIIANLLVFACIWTGINASWGLFVAYSARKAIKVRKAKTRSAEEVNRHDNQGCIALFCLSLALLSSLVLSSIYGSSIIIESMLVYNVFHTLLLAVLSIDLISFWLKDAKMR